MIKQFWTEEKVDKCCFSQMDTVSDIASRAKRQHPTKFQFHMKAACNSIVNEFSKIFEIECDLNFDLWDQENEDVNQTFDIFGRRLEQCAYCVVP